MPDEIKYIDKYETTDLQARVLACKIFVHKLSIMVVWSYFSDVVYKYARPGYLTD